MPDAWDDLDKQPILDCIANVSPLEMGDTPEVPWFLEVIQEVASVFLKTDVSFTTHISWGILFIRLTSRVIVILRI